MKEYVDVEILKQQDFRDFSNTDVMHAIDNCPRADVEPVRHAYWIPHRTIIRSPFAKNYNCSECGHESFEYPSCPFCRAKMDKENKQ